MIDRYLLSTVGFPNVKPAPYLSHAQWARVPETAYLEKLLPHLWKSHPTDQGIPSEVQGQLQDYLASVTGSGMMLLYHLRVVLDALEAEGTQCIPLKGAALAQRLYGDPLARQYNDIDLLVHPADQERALRTLTSHLGCRIEQDFLYDLDYHYSLLRPAGAAEVHIELHTGINFGGITLFPHEWWGARVPGQIGSHHISTLRDDHLLVYLCVHAALHGYGSWGWLVDIKHLLAEMQCTPDVVVQAANAVNRTAGVYHTLSLLNSMGVHVPPEILCGLKPRRDHTRLIRFLTFHGPRTSPGFCRIISLLALGGEGAESRSAWLLPPYRDFRRRYPAMTDLASKMLYVPWTLLQVGRTSVALVKSLLGFRHD